MRWIKYTLIGLAGMIVACSAIILTVVFLFDQGDYRDALVSAVEKRTGDTLKIEGPFKLGISLQPSIVASEVQLESDTDDYDVEIGRIRVQIELLPLFSRRLVIRDLSVEDVTLNIRASHDVREHPGTFGLDKIAVPVIENTLFRNIKVNYRRPEDTSPINFTLNELKIDDINDAGPVLLHGTGDLEGTEFTFKGEFGELDTLLHTDQPYPLSVNLTTPNGHYTLGGIVGNPHEGSDLDLQFDGSVPELDNVLKLFHVEMPPLGSLEFQGRIRGGLARPALEDLDINLRRGDVLEVTAKGSIGNLFTKEDTDISIEGTSSDAELIMWIMGNIPDANRFTFSGKLEASDEMFWLRDFKSEASNPSGLKLGIAGESGLVLAKQPFRHLDAKLTFSAPTSAAVRPLLFEGLPELGAVKGRGKYTSPENSDDLAMEDINIQFGPRKGLSVLATGSIGRIPLDERPIGEIAINLDIKSPTTKQVADSLDMELPELGPIRVKGLYAGSGNSSAFKDMTVIAGSPDTVLLKASGQLDFGALDAKEFVQNIKVALIVSAPSTSALSSVTGHHIPDFGTLEASGNLAGSGNNLNLSKLSVTTRKSDDLLVIIRGDVHDLTGERQWDLHAELSARDLKAVGAPFNQPLPSEGIVKAFGRIKGAPQKVHFQGQIDLSKTSMTTNITGTYGAKRPKFKGTITIPEFNVGDIGMHPPVPIKADANESKQNAKSKQGSQEIIFGRDRFNLGFMNALDLKLDIVVDEVTGSQALIDTVHAQLTLNDGTLSISPVNFVFDDGKMQLDVNLFGNAQPPRMTLSVKGDDLKIGTMLEQMQDHPIAHGFVTVVVALETQGNSPADAAANLNGRASFAAENAKVRKTELELLTTDFFGWAITSAAQSERYVNVDCAILRTDTVNGVMTIESLMLDTPSIHVKGGGTINLVDQTINMAVYPKKKNKLWRATNPIKIHGPLADPEVDAISVRAIAQNYGPLIVAPMLFVPAEVLGHLLSLIDEGGEKDSPCLKYTEADNDKAAASK